MINKIKTCNDYRQVLYRIKCINENILSLFKEQAYLNKLLDEYFKNKEEKCEN